MLTLYTFVFSSYWQYSIRQIVTRMDEEETRRTYLNSSYTCVTKFQLDSSSNVRENVFLYENDIYPEDLSPSI